jgi:NADPH:quinone reductase-like Zn-dependent oxidoreductase
MFRLQTGLRSFTTSAKRHVEARSIIYERNGEPSEIIRGHQWTLPQPSSSQVLLKVGLASVNPADINVLQGVYPTKPSKRSLPGLSEQVYVGGNEGYGIVEEVSSSSSYLKQGDWVVFGKPQMGTWSSHIVCEQEDVIKIDSKGDTALTPVMASTLQVNPATAYRMLHDFQSLKEGDVVVQNAANSAVGQAVVQIASRKLQVETINLIRNRPDMDLMRGLFSSLSKGGAPAHLFTYEDLANRDSGVKEKIKDILAGRKIKLGLNAVCGKDNFNMAKLMGAKSTIVTYGAMSKQPFSIPAGLLIFQDFEIRGFMMNQWYAKHSAQERQHLMKDLVAWYQEGSLQTPPANIVEFQQGESIDQITTKAREAVQKSMQGFGGQKTFFKFV